MQGGVQRCWGIDLPPKIDERSELLQWSAGFKLLHVAAWPTNGQKESQHSLHGFEGIFGGYESTVCKSFVSTCTYSVKSPISRQSEKPAWGFHGDPIRSSGSGVAWNIVKRGSPKLMILLKKSGARWSPPGIPSKAYVKSVYLLDCHFISKFTNLQSLPTSRRH